MNTKILLGILLVASLAGNAAFLLTTALARHDAPMAMLCQLGLTPDQDARLAESRQAFQHERMQAQERIARLRSTFAGEFAKAAPDRQRLQAASDEMARVQGEMRPKMIAHLLTLHALLTPDQRAVFAKAMHAGMGTNAACPGAMLYPTPQEGPGPLQDQGR